MKTFNDLVFKPHDADHYEIMDQIEDEDKEIYQAMLKKFED